CAVRSAPRLCGSSHPAVAQAAGKGIRSRGDAMSVQYQAIGWNRQKRIYDTILAAGVVAYLGIFIAAGALVHPNATIETLLIRAFGTAAILLLHVVLAIGPLCRLNRRFLPLLYNRR